MPQTAAQLASKGLPQLPDSKADAPWNEHAAGFSTVRPSLASVAAGI
jgi:hypothetical protein